MKYLNLLASLFVIAGWCTAFCFFVFHYRFAFNYEVDISDHYYLLFALPFLLTIALLSMLVVRPVNFSRRKLFWLLSVATICLLLLYSRHYSFGNEYFVATAAILLINSTIALVRNRFVIYTIISFTVVLYFFELYAGLQQYLDVVDYDLGIALCIKGTLENSGVYASYLVVHLPFLWMLCALKEKKISRVCQSRLRRLFWVPVCVLKFFRLVGLVSIIVVSLLSCFLIYHTQSRTAYIGLLVIIILGAYIWFRTGFGRIAARLPKIVLYVFGLVSAGGIALFSWYLFGLKKMSAMGRLMKIEITLQHLKEKLWSGTGVGRFTWYYPQWQAEYFRGNPDAPRDYFLSAGESYIIFNEYLQWFKTVGVIGAVFTVVLLICFFRAGSKRCSSLFKGLKLSVIAILACGVTSYPLHVNVQLLLMGFCFVTVFSLADLNTMSFGRIGAGLRINLAITKWGSKGVRYGYISTTVVQGLYITVLVLLLIVSVKGINVFYAARQWRNARDSIVTAGVAATQYQKLYPQLKTNGKFLSDYGALLLRDGTRSKKTIDLLDEAGQLFISRQTQEQLADAYVSAGNYANAIDTWEWVSNFLPNKFVPRRELLRLYESQNDTAGLKKTAEGILTMPVKIPSAEVDMAKEYARRLIGWPK